MGVNLFQYKTTNFQHKFSMLSRSYIRLSGQILEPIFEVFRPKAYYFHDFFVTL